MGKVRYKPLAIACSGILFLALLPLQAASAVPSGSHKIVVESTDTGTLVQLARSGATLLADYGSFSIWRTNDAQTQAVSARPSVQMRDTFDVIHLRGGKTIATTGGSNTGAPSIASNLQQSQAGGFQFWMVQYVGPIKPAWLDRLRKLGIEIVQYMPQNAYVVWLDGPRLAQLESLAATDPTVQWTGPYHPAYRLAPGLQGTTIAQSSALVPVTVQIYRTTNTPASLTSLRALGGRVLRPPQNVLRFTDISLDLPGNQLAAVAARADIFNVEPYAAPMKRDEVQGQILAGNVTPPGGGAIVPTGPGYLAFLSDHGFPQSPDQYPVVDVVDDGIDNGTTNPGQPDFYQRGDTSTGSRVIFNNSCISSGASDGHDGHGNINAGIIGAYNNRAGSPYIDGNGYDIGLGISPYGRVAGTKIFTDNEGPFDVTNCGGTDQGVVALAYNSGAQITSNSWGTATTDGAYDVEAQTYDALTRDATSGGTNTHQMLHVFAAGNCGDFGAGCDRGGPQTIESPGTAKNVLTVGATENVRGNGTLDGCGVSNAGNADSIIGFSSRGPAADLRAKPDIVAPGTHIQGPASQDPTYTGVGVCNPYYPAGQTLYTWSSGTSHSTPAIAAVASLVYNYYGRAIKPGQAPSPAMTKALILNAPRYLTGTGGTLPDANQGWGDANLSALFDSAVHRYVVDQTMTFTTTGEMLVKTGTVASSGKPFHVTLVWSDAPGSTTGNAIVNNLDLEVTIGGTVYKGNNFSGANSITGGTADTLNNVESVFLPAGASGAFSVKVTAANLADAGVPGAPGHTNQDFALVVYNGDVTAAPALSLTNVAWSDPAPGGNANGAVDPGETIALTVGITNSGDGPATAVIGTLATATGTVTLDNGTANYGDLAAGVTATNTTPFTFTVAPSHTCGVPINLSETVSYNGGLTTTFSFTIPTGTPVNGPLTTYTSTDVPKAIPDNSTIGATSTLPVSAAGSVTKVRVKVSITHTFDGDLTLRLIAPSGKSVELSTQNGGSGANYTATVFDDAATTPITSGSPPFTGSFRPEQPLATLNGTPANGTWQLFVVDGGPGDTGTITGFSLDVQAAAPACTAYPPPTVTGITPNVGAMGGGTTVTITGTNFGGATAVTFDGLAAANVTVADSRTITAVTPAHGAGTVNVQVTTNGTTLPLNGAYTYSVIRPKPPPAPGPALPGSPVAAPPPRPGAPVLPANTQPPAPIPVGR